MAAKKKSKTQMPKTVVAKVNGIKIREVRPDCFLVRVRRAGLNHSETFASLEAAKLKCSQLYNEQVNNGLSAFEIDGKTRQDANEATQLLDGRATLVQAAKLWLRHNPDSGAMTVNELADMHLAELERKRLRPETLIDARNRLRRFTNDYGDFPVMTVSPSQIEEWLSERATGAVNSNNNRRRLNAMFAYGMKRRILDVNPVQAVEPMPTDARLPEHWGPDRVEALLRAAQMFNEKLIPLYAIMAFAGLRPFEASRLNWKDIRLDERIIRVMPGTSKVRQSRIVELSDNLLAWLVPFRKEIGGIAPPQVTITRWRARLSAASLLGVEAVKQRFAKQKGLKGTEIKKQRLGWDAVVLDARKLESELWPIDVLRHSCATAWLAQHHDIYKLAEMLGNSPQVIKRHYKGLMTAKEAARYWAIMPDKETGKVISLKRQAV